MDSNQIIKTIHIISSTVLFGTGLGIAFFMFQSKFTSNLQEKFFAIRTTILADYCFTLPAVIIQPATGFWLVVNGGFNFMDTWLVITYAIYIIAGLCWIPVVIIQIKLKNILQECKNNNTALPPTFHKLFRIWFLLGWPAFIGLIIVFFLMVLKPV